MFKKIHLVCWRVWRLLDKLIIASKLTLFLLSGLKDEKLLKNKPAGNLNMQLHSRGLWIFLPNVIKNDRYNFEPYRFKVGAFLRHSAVYEGRSKSFEPDYLPLHFWAKKWYWP